MEENPQPFINVPVDSVGDAEFRSDLIRATEKIIEDKDVEDRIANHPLWAVATKTLKLSFVSSQDLPIFENMFESEVVKYLRSIPPYLHTPEIHLQIGQIRLIFQSNLRRAHGTQNRNTMNERIALLSQVKQIYTSSGNQGGSSGGVRGFFGKLLGRR